MDLFWILVCVLCLGAGVALQRYWFSDRQQLLEYEKTYLRRNGSSAVFGDYDLRSFDGGKRWYAVSVEPDGAVVVKGLVQEVMPKLLTYLECRGALLKCGTESDVMTLTGPLGDEDFTLLKEFASFNVRRT